MMEAIFPIKAQGETIPLSFNFGQDLDQGETITSASVMAVVYSGEDSDPSAILSGTPTPSGSIVTQSITGGVEGVVYQLLCYGTSSSGSTFAISGNLVVLSQ